MMRAASPAPGGFSVGWYGKIPGTGDFIARRLPAAFSEPWDAWLQQAIHASQDRLGAHWRDAFLCMPAWRFVLSPGLVTQNAWAGLMLPSVDAVGRYFPLTVASALPAAAIDAAQTLFAAAPWFAGIEEIALTAIAPKADTGAIDAAFASRPFRSEWLRLKEDPGDATVPMRPARPQMLWIALAGGGDAGLAAVAARLSEPCAAWLAEESEVFGRTIALSEGLPPGEQFCAMMDGRSIEHGWGRRDLRGAGGA